MSEIQKINRDIVDNVLCDLSREITKEAINVLKGIETKNSPWRKLFKGKPNSPWIRMSNEPNRYFLLYPKHSGPYDFELEDIRKSCFIILGEVHEKNCEKTFVSGDFFEIPSGYEYKPYTTDKICMAMVQVESEDKTFELN